MHAKHKLRAVTPTTRILLNISKRCAQVSRATRENMYKVQIGYPFLAVPSLAAYSPHQSHVPSATSEPVEHATNNPEPDCHLDCSSPGISGVESHHILQYIASFCPLAQYQPPEGIAKTVAASGRPASLPQRGKRSLSGQLARIQTVRFLPTAYIPTTPSIIAFEIHPIYVIEINIINR